MNRMKRYIELYRQMIYILTSQQKILSVLMFFLLILGSILETLGVSAIIPVVNMIVSPDLLLSSKLFNYLPFLNGLRYDQMVTVVILGVVSLYIIKNFYFAFLSWFRNKFACKIQRESSITMMKSYMSRGYEFFLGTNFGELNRGVSTDTAGIYYIVNNICKLMADSITILMICLFLIITDWQITVALAMLALVCVTLIYFVFRKKMLTVGIMRREYSAKLGQTINQSIYGIKDVIILRKQKFFIEEYEKEKIGEQKMQVKAVMGEELPAYVIEGVCVSGLMLAVGIKILVGGVEEGFVASLASIAVGTFRILPYLGRISSEINIVTQYLSSVPAVYGNIKTAREYSVNHPETDYDRIQWDCDKLLDVQKEYFKKDLSLRNVTFRYRCNSDSRYILNKINLSVKKRQAVAIIGSSGAGKSTIADVLLGLLVPESGGVYMDGVMISDIPVIWSKVVGYVPQSVFLCDASIKQNIAFGEREEEIDIDRVMEAVERAELSEFIGNLQYGIDTFVGDRGIRLSGGQRQRIAIARALYHRPEILVLDEATSALDNETEAAIMSAITALQGHSTLIIIAHRLTTIRSCDVIYEIADGELKERKKEEIFAGLG